ncbi:ORF087 [Staphylococcus phage Twort]|uniref:ORF087 n=1 Tax=Staphylococcus phage Twort (strain DSM 17442 / HER 48) TaxID=2908167 RepID=Q4Z9E0_BPTWO|nr:ORF087 [Staphylococcus phage Twort]AAX92381.1 ORF087 [Staphylococcus phage Twort]
MKLKSYFRSSKSMHFVSQNFTSFKNKGRVLLPYPYTLLCLFVNISMLLLKVLFNRSSTAIAVSLGLSEPSILIFILILLLLFTEELLLCELGINDDTGVLLNEDCCNGLPQLPPPPPAYAFLYLLALETRLPIIASPAPIRSKS